MSQQSKIVIAGAREHNLKNITVDIPRDALVVVTGLSGSGKSSLAFDTIYAEGQRRYVESLSAYARQFLGQMDKPDVDSIEGLSPAISIDQKTTSKNPRSTVGTVTEIYDYLRLLWSRVGTPHCYNCGKPIEGQSVQQIVDQILELEDKTKFMVLAPIVRGRKGEYQKLLESLKVEGFTRVKIDGEVYLLDEEINLDKKLKHDISVVIDRLVVRDNVRRRLTDSVETAVKLAEGLIEVENVDSGEVLTFSENFACIECGTGIPELEPRIFSFNSPHGACSHCTGLGSQREVDPELVVPNEDLSLGQGALAPWAGSGAHYYEQIQTALVQHYGIDPDSPWKELPEEHRNIFMNGAPEAIKAEYRTRKGRKRTYTLRFEGLIKRLKSRYQDTESEAVREWVEQYMAIKLCPECDGTRLRRESRSVLVDGLAIHEFTAFSIDRSLQWLDSVSLTKQQQQIARLILREIVERLTFLSNVGVGYLNLNRAAGTLSGGEAQRIRLATQIGSSLVGVLYILDEPSIGLHQRDNERLIATLERLRDVGNTVIVVEHDEQTIRMADYVIDLGPGAGEHGGEIVAKGTPKEIERAKNSQTAQFLTGERRIEVPKQRRTPDGELKIVGASGNNLRSVDVSIPLKVMCCITGVSGSGKSTLINSTLYPALASKLHRSRERPAKHSSIEGLDSIDKVVNVDQSPIGRTPRSNPATYTGMFDLIRKLFSQTEEARSRGYKPGRFSFNVKGGRCEVCKGDGQIKIEMHFLPDVYVPCEECDSKRYNRETLEVKFKGKSIADVLQMSIEEGLEFFSSIPTVKRRLQTLHDVGLDYMRLGQSATTLSGGEAQRIKLATELARVATGKTLYILDEPTTGLHFADIERLLTVLHRLVDSGNTVVVIEHNLDVIKTADQIIDLGPEGGEGGGQIVAVGTPEEVVKVKQSHTAEFLAELLKTAGSSESSSKKELAVVE